MAWYRCVGGAGGSLKLRTASGRIASFSTNMVEAFKSLKSDINPVQSGSGTPSPQNVRPISGFSALNVTRTGVNLWNEDWERGLISITTGANISGVGIRSKTFCKCDSGKTYFMACPNGSYLLWYDANQNYLSATSFTGNLAITVPNNAVWFKVRFDGSNTYANNISLNSVVTDTTYHAYNGQTATVNFGQTVYGGVCDITNGKVNKTHALTPLNNKSWVKSGNKFYTTGFDNAPDGALYTGDFACAIGTPVNKEWNALSVGECCLRSGLYSLNKWSFVYCTDAYSTVEEFVSALNADCTITYPLATPIEITTTPENLSALSGQNNVYSDTNGDTEVKYLYRGVTL